MSDFVKYQHIERIGLCGNELDGLLDGTVYVYPKLDGACHCVYFDRDLCRVAIASRNQLLSEGYDSTRFWHFVNEHPLVTDYIRGHSNLRVYGEFLTPHTVRNYIDDAWNKWYIFDVWDDEKGRWLNFQEVLDVYSGINSPDVRMIPFLKIMESPSIEELNAVMDQDDYLLQKGTQGEGIVIKNYDYVNPYGRRTWGKIVRESFKTKFKSKNKGERIILPEESATENSISEEFVSKEFHKFTTDRGIQWTMSMTPDFLKYVWREWWMDYSYDALSDLKTVDMKTVRKVLSSKTMRLLNRIIIN